MSTATCRYCRRTNDWVLGSTFRCRGCGRVQTVIQPKQTGSPSLRPPPRDWDPLKDPPTRRHPNTGSRSQRRSGRRGDSDIQFEDGRFTYSLGDDALDLHFAPGEEDTPERVQQTENDQGSDDYSVGYDGEAEARSDPFTLGYRPDQDPGDAQELKELRGDDTPTSSRTHDDVQAEIDALMAVMNPTEEPSSSSHDDTPEETTTDPDSSASLDEPTDEVPEDSWSETDDLEPHDVTNDDALTDDRSDTDECTDVTDDQSRRENSDDSAGDDPSDSATPEPDPTPASADTPGSVNSQTSASSRTSDSTSDPAGDSAPADSSSSDYDSDTIYDDDW